MKTKKVDLSSDDKEKINLYMEELIKDLRYLKESFKYKKWNIALHYSSGLNQLSDWINTILKKYQ